MAKIGQFLDDYFTVDRETDDQLTYLRLSKGDAELWGSIARSLFESELLSPLSHVTEYIRSYKLLEDYLPLIHLIKEPEMVKREYLFTTLREIQAENAEGVKQVLYKIYGDDDTWDALDSALALNNLREFEKHIGSDERAVNLKKIVCHFQSIKDREVVVYSRFDHPMLIETKEYNSVPDSTTLEDMKLLAKDLLLTCSMMMLSTKEEQNIKRICNNKFLTNELSFEGMRYYVRIRNKKATTINNDANVEPVEEVKPQPKIESTSDPYTRKDMMKKFKISSGTLENWSIAGDLNKIKIGGRVYFDRTEVDELVKQNKLKRK